MLGALGLIHPPGVLQTEAAKRPGTPFLLEVSPWAQQTPQGAIPSKV